MSFAYPLAMDTFGSEEIEAARKVLSSGMLTMGETVRECEEAFARWTGVNHAIMVNSGSSANLLIIDALLRSSTNVAQLKPGDEVIVPALSWPTTVWPIVQLGLKPVFVDVDPNTLAIDLSSVESILGPRTRAMFLIHVLGQIPDMDEYQRFCEKHNILLIEDACESLGGHHSEKHVGSFGLMASFSCYYSHHISTIEGGFIATDNIDFCDDLRSLRSHGWIRDREDRQHWVDKNQQIDPRFMFIMPGYNVRPGEINAAIGLVQLERLDEMLRLREKVARSVHEWLRSETPWLRLIGSERLQGGPTQNRRARNHSWMTLPIQITEPERCSVSKVQEHLQSAGVDTRPIIAGNLARHPGVTMCDFRAASSLAVCDRLLATGFMIGCHPTDKEETLSVLHEAIRSLGRSL